MTTATAKLVKWGNGQGVLIPKSMCEQLSLHIGDKLIVETHDDGIRVKPAKPSFHRTKKVTIEELFEGWEGVYEPPADFPLTDKEFDWGSPVGKEIW